MLMPRSTYEWGILVCNAQINGFLPEGLDDCRFIENLAGAPKLYEFIGEKFGNGFRRVAHVPLVEGGFQLEQAVGVLAG